MAYYIGVDGGGTKSAFALFDEQKNIVAEYMGGGSNHESLAGAFDEASAVIWDGVTRLLAGAGISLDEVAFTLMGLAGIDHPFQYDIMCGMLRDFGLSRFEIFNDGFIVVKAGSESGAAIGYNCGTGNCCNAIDSRGNRLQLGGLGLGSGDVGGGRWLAQKTFGLIYDEVYLNLHKSVVTQMFYDFYKPQSREEFIASIAELQGENARAYIEKLLDFFFDAIALADGPALKVTEGMAERGAEMIAALAKQMEFDREPIEVVLSGSIHTKLDEEGIYSNLLKAKARAKSGKQLQFILLDNPPVVGCVNWIFQDYL